MPNKTPWRRLLVEGGVIVASILLAFAVDAWWDEWREGQAVRVHLDALAAEIDAQTHEAEQGLQRRGERMRVMETLVAASSPRAPTGITADSVDHLLGLLWGAWDPLPPLAALDNLHESGIFPGIRSNDLRLALAQLERSIDQAANHDERVLRSWEEGLRPYLVTRTDARTQVAARPFDLRDYSASFDRDVTLVLTDPEFQNHLLVRMNRTASAMTAAQDVLQRLQTAATLIDEELGR